MNLFPGGQHFPIAPSRGDAARVRRLGLLRE
jgi:hypothetical protein